MKKVETPYGHHYEDKVTVQTPQGPIHCDYHSGYKEDGMGPSIHFTWDRHPPREDKPGDGPIVEDDHVLGILTSDDIGTDITAFHGSTMPILLDDEVEWDGDGIPDEEDLKEYIEILFRSRKDAGMVDNLN